jgi:hypothetical protein
VPTSSRSEASRLLLLLLLFPDTKRPFPSLTSCLSCLPKTRHSEPHATWSCLALLPCLLPGPTPASHHTVDTHALQVNDINLPLVCTCQLGENLVHCQLLLELNEMGTQSAGMKEVPSFCHQPRLSCYSHQQVSLQNRRQLKREQGSWSGLA